MAKSNLHFVVHRFYIMLYLFVVATGFNMWYENSDIKLLIGLAVCVVVVIVAHRIQITAINPKTLQEFKDETDA